MKNNFYDAIIIGGGPAGLSSAIYTARAKYKTLVLEKNKFGGQITITSEVVNYPGVYHTSGEDLTKEMQKQAAAFGAEFLLANVQSFAKDKDFFTVKTDKGEFCTLGLIVASGASPRMVGFKGEEEFKGRGVAYCATCDGEFFSGKDIYVVGSGFAACEESLFLTRFASKIHMIIIGDDFTCTGSVVEEVKAHEKINLLYNTSVKEVFGENYVKGISLIQNGKELNFSDEKGIGVFVFAGYAPASANFADTIRLNEQKYIITDENRKTNIDGVYAAGDICIKNLRQVVTAVSDGATAATSLEKHIAAEYDRLKLEKREYSAPKKQQVKNDTVKQTASDDSSFISSEIKEQLEPVISRFSSNIILKYKLDEKEISNEVEGFMGELSTLSDKIICKKDDTLNAKALPAISIFDATDNNKGVSFHGVPGGHEFNSFVVGLYNAAGPGQIIAQEDIERINAINKQIQIDLAVTLSCTNCPELVMAVERIALLNDNITLDIYDLSKYEDLKAKHNIMSVPCMVINDTQVHFGKKSISEVLSVLEGI